MITVWRLSTSKICYQVEQSREWIECQMSFEILRGQQRQLLHTALTVHKANCHPLTPLTYLTEMRGADALGRINTN